MELLETIDRASFIVCLDDESPESASDRANQYLLGSVSQRWGDKSLELVICKNGASAHVCEHSMLDGGSVQQFSEYIQRAILGHEREMHSIGSGDGVNGHRSHVEELEFVTNPEIENDICRIEKYYFNTNWRIEYNHYACTELGSIFLRAQKCAPKAAYQLIIQLASFKYFGYLPPCWEAVSMRAFYQGRIDLLQTVLPPVAQFCKAMSDPTKSSDSNRRIFHEACKAYTSTLTRISRGRGFESHLYALQEVLEDDEEMPAIFRDPIYEYTRPRKKMMVSSVPWHDVLQEAGTWAPDPENLWIHYEVEEETYVFIGFENGTK